MKTRKNHPEMVILDLIGDLMMRLDLVLDQLHRSASSFRSAFGADPAQPGRAWRAPTDAMTNELQRLPRLTPPRDIRQVLLDLHVLHTRLGDLIRELELEAGLDPD